jgi:anthranilate synthase/aminodeoxychorismate synthase-like glutamine amidotransferase
MSAKDGFRRVRRPLGWPLAPADVLRLVREDAHPVALSGAWAGGSDLVAAEPVLVRSAPGPLSDVLDAPWPAGACGTADGAAASSAAGVAEAAGAGDAAGRDLAGGSGAVGGGWIGYLGYSAGGEALPPAGPRALPAWWFGYYDHVLRRMRASGEWYFEALCTPGRADALDRRLAELTRRAAARAHGPRDYAFGPFRLVPGAERHQAAVRRAVEYIHQGDIFQANITLRAEADFAGDPLDAFCRGVTELDPPYAAFIGVSAPGAARAAVASLSPELFLRRAHSPAGPGTVASKPIKGTARRAADAGRAAAQRAGLEASAKDRAENVMIVDLVRNDLSRVCVPGTVTVPVLLGPESHPGVWHLVSTVTGALRPGTGDGDLIRAAFPPGSVTGAPKVRALEVIDELEASPREAYTGAVGYRSPAAGLELNVAIRTFEFSAGRAWLGAGGGIVADSDPAAEYAECLIKATPLFTAVGARLDTAAQAIDPVQRASDPNYLGALSPRPSAGVFSSLLVTDGETRDLAAHLSRLEASVRGLYGKDLPASLADQLASCLAARPSGRLRITVRPVGGPLQATVEVVPLASPPTPLASPPAPTHEIAATGGGAGPPSFLSDSVTLHPVAVPGGIGAHKYRDRRLLAELNARMRLSPGQLLLLVDETGELLETDRANVFAVIDGVLLTPPADGRLLPGTTRAAVLRAARSRGIRAGQKPLTLDELTEATEVFVTNAVAGVIPVTAIADARLHWPSDPVAAAGSGHLRWLPGPVAAALAASLATRPPDAPPAASPAIPSAPAFPSDPTAPFPERARIGPGFPRHGSSGPGAPRAVTEMDQGSPGTERGAARPLVILIDNYDSFTWNLAHLLDIAGARVEVVRNDEVTAGQVIAAAPAGVVISPGPGFPAEAGISIATVAACAATGVPLLGICLGHQAIGAAFGADIIAAPRPVHGTAFPVTHDGAGVFRGLPRPFQATRYHSLIVDEATLPPDLLVTARTDGIPMALRHATRPVEGVQFHPESILTTHGHAIIGNFVRSTARA